jgi:hypothetical protein
MLAWNNRWFQQGYPVTLALNNSAPVTIEVISELLPTLEAVRANCDIADARHATDYTLCVYLLKMREYFRWEKNISFNQQLPHQELTEWLSCRESRWETLQSRDFVKIPVMNTLHEPFDTEAINQALNPLGYVYSSGYGRSMKPMFYLGALESRETYKGYTLIISGREYARDLASQPAMSLGKTIYLRRESLRRMLWEKVEEWHWNKPLNAMQNALACYDFDNNTVQSLNTMTNNELHSVKLHEIGEVQAGERLGNEWEAMLAGLPHSKTEIMVRAVRDHLADALSTLPDLLSEMNVPALHFYIANLTNMRKQLYPSLIAAYEIWTTTGDKRAFECCTSDSVAHWQILCEDILVIYRQKSAGYQQELVSLIESSPL